MTAPVYDRRGTAKMPLTFGERVRARRTSRHLTLQALAAASGVSVPMLSQVERGERVPTLPIALRIAEGLACHLSDLLDGPAPAVQGVLRQEEASGAVDPETGVHRVLLSRNLPPSVAEVTWYRLPPGAEAGPFVHRDPRLQEQVTVVRGRLTATVGDEVYAVRVGDTLTYSGAVEHHFANHGRGECSFVHLAHPARA